MRIFQQRLCVLAQLFRMRDDIDEGQIRLAFLKNFAFSKNDKNARKVLTNLSGISFIKFRVYARIISVVKPKIQDFHIFRGFFRLIFLCSACQITAVKTGDIS